MKINTVNAGEKTMDDIKQMIKELDDDTMLSIDFSGFAGQENSHE